MPGPRDDRPRRVVARDRIQRLLSLAEQAAVEGRHDDAARYGALAWKLTTRYVLEPSPDLKARVCRGCKAYLLSGQTARVRVTGGKVSTTCLACGRVQRIPFTEEQRSRRTQASP